LPHGQGVAAPYVYHAAGALRLRRLSGAQCAQRKNEQHCRDAYFYHVVSICHAGYEIPDVWNFRCVKYQVYEISCVWNFRCVEFQVCEKLMLEIPALEIPVV
jgi:hypothetical protein